jgi:cell division protein FtsW
MNERRIGYRIKSLISSDGGRYDSVFIIAVMLLAICGTVMVFSAGYAYADFRYGDGLYFVKRQTVWIVFGTIAMLTVSRIDLSLIKKHTVKAYVLTLVLLVLTLLIGFVGNGAQRWIAIGPITIQPSEIAKLTMTMMLARYFDQNSDVIFTKNKRDILIRGTVIPCTIIAVPILLVMLQHHLSCIIILGIIGILMIVASGADLRFIGGCCAAGLVGVCYIAFFTDYTKDRITVWLDPERYKLTGGWQTLQGLMAIGSGGIFGKGLGKGELKYCYVSEPANDMIFAVLCEELGLVGAMMTLGLFALLIFRGFTIALKNDDTYSRLLTLGICIKIAVQVLLNVAVVTNTIPNTGISLPFFSYGGSSLIMIFAEMGIIMSASRKSKIKK